MRVPFHQQKNGSPGLVLAFDEVFGRGEGFLVDGLHTLLGQRAEVFDGLPTLAVGFALEHAAGPELLDERLAVGKYHVGWIVFVLRLFLGIEVIEAAKEFVEAVHGRQVLVAVALVVLAELAGGVALALEHGGHRQSVFCQPSFAPGSPTLVMPQRTGTLPLMNAARPAVQLCWP